MTRLQANALLITIAAIWGLAFVFQKTAMSHIGPFLFLAVRSAIATLILAPLAWRENAGLSASPAMGFWQISALGGTTFFIGGILQQIGIVSATVTNTGLLTGLYVVITPMMLWWFLSRPPSPVIWSAVVLAFVGTWLLGGGTIGGFSFGDWLVAISAFFWAAHILVVSHSARYFRPIGFTAVQFAVVAVMAGIGTAAFETVDIGKLWEAAPELAYVGILSSALTFTLLAIAMRHAPPAEATILVSLETVFAALAGVLLLGENLQWIGWTGAAMMFGASLLVQLAPERKSAAKPTV